MHSYLFTYALILGRIVVNGLIIVYRNTWLGNQNILIIDFIVNIILDYLKKTVYNVFTITTNIQGYKKVLCKSMEVERMVKEVLWNF